MGKPLVIVLTLAFFGVALYVFYVHERNPVAEKLRTTETRSARVTLEQFALLQTKGGVIQSTWTGRTANVYEPNVVELSGDVKGTRMLPGGQEEVVGGETATAWFDVSSLGGMMGNPQLQRAEIRGFVELLARDHAITTDAIEYLPMFNVMRTNLPVRVEGPGREFQGESGFSWDLASDKIEFPGKVRGRFIVDDPGAGVKTP